MIQKSHSFIEFKNLEDAKKCLDEVGIDNKLENSQNNLQYSKKKI